MSARELVVLGTGSQAPTRHRNHNGYLLRFDDHGLLFDPGEGTQRQLLLAGVAASTIDRIWLTHLHGDHCLGLPGVLQRLALDRVTHPVVLHHPASGAPYVERLRHATPYRDPVDVRTEPVGTDGGVLADLGGGLVLSARPLDHRIDAVGYRFAEPDGRRMRPDLLERAGVRGPAVGALAGRIAAGRRADRAGGECQRAAPGPGRGDRHGHATCAGADELAVGADLLLIESTFLTADAELAEAYGHLTARQPGRSPPAPGCDGWC